jgi:hypothetical protein
MGKKPSEDTIHSWAIYRFRGAPAKLLGIVDAADEDAAIAKAIEEFELTGTQRSRLVAQRRD